MKNKPYPLYDIHRVYTLKEMLEYRVGVNPKADAFMYVDKKKELITKSIKDLFDDCNALGSFLFSKGFKNCKIAVIGENSYEWIVSYFAVVNGSNVIVPLDKELGAEDLAELVNDSECSAIIHSDGYTDIANALRDMCPTLKEFIPMSKVFSMIEQGATLIKNGYRDYVDKEVLKSDLACIVYTSGTTGKSKGVMLTHDNLASDAVFTCRNATGSGVTVLILPLHHTFGIVASVFAPILYGCGVYICTSMKNVVSDLKKYKPTVIILVPMIVETIYKKIWEGADKCGKAKQLKALVKFSNAMLMAGIDMRRQLFRSVFEPFGGRLEMIISGGAALDNDCLDGFISFGITVVNGYGITECSPVVAVNRNKYFRRGSVGVPVACCEVKIDAPDSDGIGEILVRGDNVMEGYYNNEEATREAFDGDWFKTGDYGKIDEDGFLFITGRKKNLIVLSNGKNVSPEELEEKILKLPYVKEVVVYEQDKTITAEVFLNEELDPKCSEKINADIDKLNRRIPPYKNIGKVVVRETEFPKTTTLKIKRNYTEVGKNA